MDYSWIRYWIPRGIERNWYSGNTFVDDLSRLQLEGSAFTLKELIDLPCLILLGEPGSGKSTELAQHYDLLNSQFRAGPDAILRFDLREFQSDDRLFTKLENSREIKLWLEGNHRLFLFLDSLDESLITINTLATAILSEFSGWPIERLYLRIFCRTADWPRVLEEGLINIWGQDNVKILELAHLSRSDVDNASRSKGIDSAQFLNEIITKEVGPLARVPITLNFLLTTHTSNNQLPSSKKDLYYEGCQLLCAEVNQSRLSSHRAGRLTSQQRLIIAARIAALFIFTKRSAIWIDAETEEVPKNDINKSELIGGVEQINGHNFSIGLQEIEETLGTALFSSRGSSRLGWSHQTYAEFLAAWYLYQHQFCIDQILSLIIHPNDPEYIIPQLHETASWLVSFSREVFREIMNREPIVLLRSDASEMDSFERTQLIDTLLGQVEHEKIFDLEWEDRSRLSKLAHPMLENQLKPYVNNSTINERARRVAIEIVETCSITQLQGELVNIALNVEESESIRVAASHALLNIGEEHVKAKLKPLAYGQAGEDPYDELKGYGIRCLWPGHISTEELFNILTPQKQDNFSGSYMQFLYHDLPQKISPEDLPVALDWICDTPSKRSISYSMVALVDSIMLKAWENLDFSGVLPQFAKAALSRLGQMDDIFSQDRAIGGPEKLNPRIMIENDNEKRHKVVQEIVPLLVNSNIDHIHLIYSGTPLIFEKDFNWLFTLYHGNKTTPIKKIIVSCISNIFNPNNGEQVVKLFYECQNDNLINDFFKHYFEPVELYTTQTEELKMRWEQFQTRQNIHIKTPILEPSPSVRITTLLNKFEEGEIDAFWMLNREMTLHESSTHYGDEFIIDLTILPGWLKSDDITRERIIRYAKDYLQNYELCSDTWPTTNTIFRPAYSGYRAFILLLQTQPDFFDRLTPLTWKKWTPSILKISRANISSTSFSVQKYEQDLLKLAYFHAPNELIETLISLINYENQEQGDANVVEKIESIWDDRIANEILNKAADSLLAIASLRKLLQILLRHQYNPAIELAESLISLQRLTNETLRGKAILAAQMLMMYSEHGGWTTIWPLIQNDELYGQDIIVGLVDYLGRRGELVFKHLTPDQLIDLYQWLVLQYPPEEDPDICGIHTVSTRENISEWRNSIISYLANLATQDACYALEHLVIKDRQTVWLKYYLIQAKANLRHRTWTPPTPTDFLNMFKYKEVRLIESGDQLLNVIIDSLNRLEEKIQGETPAVFDIWNEIEKNRFTPKNENDLSNYIKRHLETDLQGRGIIANREVEIRRGTGSASGERTDIHIDAVKRTSRSTELDIITVIIEVKGCWNKQLDHAMETQLKERYLQENNCQFGLYLVGWYFCQEWDDTDSRKSKCPKCNLQEAKQKFSEQAISLSDEQVTIRSFILDTALSKS